MENLIPQLEQRLFPTSERRAGPTRPLMFQTYVSAALSQGLNTLRLCELTLTAAKNFYQSSQLLMLST